MWGQSIGATALLTAHRGPVALDPRSELLIGDEKRLDVAAVLALHRHHLQKKGACGGQNGMDAVAKG